MKTMIAYASKTGTTQKCAQMLAERIQGATLVDLTKEKPNPAQYDAVIVGGSVRMGVLHVDARQYLDGAKPLLLQKRLGIFLCAGFDAQKEKLFANNVDPELLQHAVCHECFGGEIHMEKLRGFEKLVTRMVIKSGKSDPSSLPKLFPERIDRFAQEMQMEE